MGLSLCLCTATWNMACCKLCCKTPSTNSLKMTDWINVYLTIFFFTFLLFFSERRIWQIISISRMWRWDGNEHSDWVNDLSCIYCIYFIENSSYISLLLFFVNTPLTIFDNRIFGLHFPACDIDRTSFSIILLSFAFDRFFLDGPTGVH